MKNKITTDIIKNILVKYKDEYIETLKILPEYLPSRIFCYNLLEFVLLKLDDKEEYFYDFKEFIISPAYTDDDWYYIYVTNENYKEYDIIFYMNTKYIKNNLINLVNVNNVRTEKDIYHLYNVSLKCLEYKNLKLYDEYLMDWRNE